MSDVFDLRARVSADASSFNNAMDSSAASVSSALSSINSAAKMFVGTGVVRAFAKATNAAYEFGQVMADISSISDVGIQQLSNSIKQLDNVYGSMSSVGNSIYNIISSGFDRSNDELIEIVKNVGQASKSIRADLYSTANVFTTVANAYNLSADRFKDIADLLFVTVEEGKAEGNELARTLGLVVNTASEAGLSFAELSAVISTLSRTQTTSQAMIGFNQMLNAMIKPSKEAADTAKQFGIEFGAAALKSKGFTAIIKDMHDKLQGNVEAINKISGPIRAMRAVVSLTGKQYENFIDILEKAEAKIGTGVAMEAFAKQTDTAKQALENLKVQLDKTFVGVGKDLEPLTIWLTKVAEDALKAFSNSEGIGKWSIYVTALLGSFKGIYTLLNGLSSILLANTDKTTSKAKTYADHMERAKNATKDVAMATSNISKNLTNSTVKFKSGEVLGSEVLYQSKGYTPNTVTDSQRANVLRTMQDRLAKARESVASAQRAHTPNIKPFYEAKNSLQRATSGRDAAQAKFFDAMDLRKEAQRRLKDTQWSAQNLTAQLPLFQRNSSYGKELQANLDAQLKKAQEDVNHMMQVETGAREIYYKSEKSLADAQLRFDSASKAYATSVSKLKQAQAELQSMAKAEKAIVTSYRNTASSEGNVEAASRPTKDLAMTKTQKANARKVKATRRAAMSFEQQDALITRYNKRFKKNYEYLGERINRTGIDWKRSFAEILGKGGALSKLYNGLFAVTSVLAAWETGWAIGTAIAKKLKVIDWKLTQAIADLSVGKITESTKRQEKEIAEHNIKMVKEAGMRLAHDLVTKDKLNEAVISEIVQHLLLADTLEEVQKWYRQLMQEKPTEKPTEKSPADVRKDVKQDYAERRKEALDKMEKGEFEAGVSLTKQMEELLKKSGKSLTTKGLDETTKNELRNLFYGENWQSADIETFVARKANEFATKALINYIRPIAYPNNTRRTFDTSEYESKVSKQTEAYSQTLKKIAETLREMRVNDMRDAKSMEARRQAVEEQNLVDEQKDTLNKIVEKEKSRPSSFSVKESSTYKKYISGYQEGDQLDQFAILQEAKSVYDKRVESYKRLQEQREKSIAELKDAKVSDEGIKKATAGITGEIETLAGQLITDKNAINNLLDDYSKYVESQVASIGAELDTIGINPDSLVGTNQQYQRLADMLAEYEKKLADATDDTIREAVGRQVTYIKEQMSKVQERFRDRKKQIRDAKVNAGLMTETQAMAEQVAVEQADIAQQKAEIAQNDGELKYEMALRRSIDDYIGGVRSRREEATSSGDTAAAEKYAKEEEELQARRDSLTKSIKGHEARRLQLNESLLKSSLNLRIAFNKLADSTNEAKDKLMGTIKEFANQRDDSGRMTNDALWHSVNLSARMGRMTRSAPFMVSTMSIPNRQKAANMRQKAQSAVSASVDSFIMSQKYAEANMGKAVTDIRDYIVKQNTIMVRR